MCVCVCVCVRVCVCARALLGVRVCTHIICTGVRWATRSAEIDALSLEELRYMVQVPGEGKLRDDLDKPEYQKWLAEFDARYVYLRVCACMHACMHVKMYVFLPSRTCVRTYVCVYVCMYVCTHARMHVCMNVIGTTARR